MRKIERLKREAMESCVWRGHTMTRWQASDFWPNAASCHCIVCDASVAVTTNPPPNGIEIGGDAVAINCKRGPK